MTDEPDTADLENRIDELEEKINRMLPSRREVIGMGAAGLAGAGLMSGTASAGSSSVGTIGAAPNDLVDIEAEDVTIQDTLNNASISGAAAGEAIQSDGSGNLQFGAVEAVQEVSTFDNLPPIDPPQLAFVTDESEYYHSEPQSGTRFDIGSAIFSKDINTQGSVPGGIAINNDGTRLYESGIDKIHQFQLSTPFDIASASFDTSISTNNNESDARGLAFSNDGTIMVVIIISPDIIQQYSLSTAFDINSASFDTDIPTQGTSPTDIEFNNDGTRLYEVHPSDIFESSLSTPFDIASATFEKSTNTQDSATQGIAFNNDGTRLYEVGDNTDTIFQSSLSTPFDVASGTLSKSINTQDVSPQGIAFNSDGSRLYEVGNNADKIYQSQLSSGGWIAF